MKALIKPSEAPQRSVKINIQVNFYFIAFFRNVWEGRIKSNPAKIMSLKSSKFSDTLSVFLNKRLSRGQIFFHQKAKSESKSGFSPKYLIFYV